MNTFTKLLAPAALAFAVFGAQAGEITAGDIGAQPVTAGPSVAVRINTPVAASGEVSVGDLGMTAPTPSQAIPPTRNAMSQPVRSLYAIGA